MKINKILIIAAHPDDDILGCGGFISKYSSIKKIRVIFIAEGSSCRFNKKDLNSDLAIKTINKRNNFGIEALKTLGVNQFQFYNLPCGRLDQTPIIDINKIIESEINKYKPDTIFTHSFDDTNNDHQIVHKATLMATRPGAKNLVNHILTYEILSSSEWRFTHVFKPNFFEVLSEFDLERKCKALKKYESEINNFPHPRSKDGIYTLAKYRGMQSATSYAESFRVIRSINK